MDVRCATAMAGQVQNVAEFCRVQGISRQTFYKWRRRFVMDGVDGLREHSRRPLSTPGRTAASTEEVVLRLRKQLDEDGRDNGPQSIRWALESSSAAVDVIPSRATIWRILQRHGLINPQPRKRPKSATTRFTYARPNECWQSDWTEWKLADSTRAAIAGTLDDHSRYLPALAADLADASAAHVWTVMLSGIAECGVPQRSLTDNGRVYSGKRSGFESAFERNLRALGSQSIASTPRHPQTCGKIERFWQTLKKWLAARDRATTIAELNDQLAEFRQFYNHQRPHRALHGATPAEAFAATVRARPQVRPIAAPVFVVRNVVDPRSGNIIAGPYKVQVGKRWSGHECDCIIDGDHIVIFSGNRIVRELDADPSRKYQRGVKVPGVYGKREPNPAH